MIIRAVLNVQSLEWLRDHRFLLNRRGGRRLRPGDKLDFSDTAELEPHVGIYQGAAVCPVGSLSYSHSPLSPKNRIGRLRLIGPDVALHLAFYQMSHVSTSDLTHDPGLLPYEPVWSGRRPSL